MSAVACPAGLAVLVPLLAAGLLVLVPDWRAAAWGNLAAAVLSLVFAGMAALGLGAPAGAGLLADGLGLYGAVLTGFVAVAAAWSGRGFVAIEAAEGRLDARALRLCPVLFQALLGCLLLALLADSPAVAWVGIEGATVAAALAVGLPGTRAAEAAARRLLILCGGGVALALLGTVLLSLAAGAEAASWTGLARAAPGCDGAVLSLAFVFLLVGYGAVAGLAPLHLWVADAQAAGPAPLCALLSGGGMNVALVLLLRARAVLAANAAAGMGAIRPGPLMMALGLASVLLAGTALWRRRDGKRFLAACGIGQGGVAAFAFGLGGPASGFAGLLYMGMATLTRMAAWSCVSRAAQLKRGPRFADMGGLLATHRVLGLTLAASLIALAGLPPFGLFSGTVLVMVATLARAPLLALPLGLGLLAGAVALIAALHALCLGEATPDRAGLPRGALGATALAPAWLCLALAVWLGLAMPAELVAWLRAIAGGMG